jgi:hypothetical protein
MARTDADSALIEYRDGIHLHGTVLWFDSVRRQELTFISHANVPRAQRHGEILATEATAKLLQAMGQVDGRGRRVHKPRALVTPYGRPFALGQLALTLIPSGYCLGSANLLVEYQSKRILYAGRINPRRHALAAPLQARTCDQLVLACPLGAKRGAALPPSDREAGAFLRHVLESLDEGRTPIIFCSAVGEAQEVIRLLAEADVEMQVHRTIYAATKVYREEGLHSAEQLSAVRRFQQPWSGNTRRALLWPLPLRNSPTIRRFPAHRPVLVSDLTIHGLNLDQAAGERAFALGFDADYRGLLSFVNACDAKEIVLSGPQVADLQQDLIALGRRARQIAPQQQLTLF